MELKVVLGILVAAGAAAGLLYFVMKTRQTEEEAPHKEDEKLDHTLDIAEYRNGGDETAKDLGHIKTESAEKIKERHEEAESVIRESVDNIFGEDTSGRETKNESVKKKIFDDIDNI